MTPWFIAGIAAGDFAKSFISALLPVDVETQSAGPWTLATNAPSRVQATSIQTVISWPIKAFFNAAIDTRAVAFNLRNAATLQIPDTCGTVICLWPNGDAAVARSNELSPDVYIVNVNGGHLISNRIDVLAPAIRSVDVDFASVASCMRHGAPIPGRTLVSGITRAEAGCVTMLSTKGVSVAACANGYDDLVRSPSSTKDDTEELLRKRLLAATDALLGTLDNPVIPLSGGIDSALTAWAASKVKRSGQKLNTIYAHVGNEHVRGQRNDLPERETARAVAERLGAVHEEVDIGAYFTAPDITSIASRCAAGFTYPTQLHYTGLARAAKERGYGSMLMGLTGDGALDGVKNEPLITAYLNHTPLGLVWNAARRLSNVRAYRGAAHLVLKRKGMVVPIGSPFSVLTELFSAVYIQKLFGSDIAFETDALLHLRPEFHEGKGLDASQHLTFIRASSSIPNMWVGVMEQSVSREGVSWADPFADLGFMQASISIPHRFKRDGDISKVTARSIVAKEIGADVAYRQKYGFSPRNIYDLFRTEIDFAGEVIDSGLLDAFPSPSAAKAALLDSRKVQWTLYCVAKSLAAWRHAQQRSPAPTLAGVDT